MDRPSHGQQPPPAVIVAGVLAVVALVYLPTLTFGFVYDDHWTIVANGFLRQPSQLGVLLTPAAVAQHVPDAFRPVLAAFDMLTYQVLGLYAPAHHAVSVCLHVGVCLALERWLAGLGAPLLLRVATAGLFGVLAVHAEAVAVVSFREDVLAALLGLLALLAADRSLEARSGRRVGWLALAALGQALACGTKMSAASLPLLWWLVHASSPWRPRRPAAQRALAMVALGVGVALAVAHTLHLYGAANPYGVGDNPRLLATRIGLAPVLAASTQIHLGYLQQMVVPLGLSPEYVDAGAAWGDVATVLATLALAALLVVGVASWRRRPIVAIATLGAFALAIPTSNLFPMPNMRADRFTYLTSLPVCLGLAATCLYAGDRLAQRLRRPWLALAVVLAYAVVQGGVAQATSHVYRSDSHLWSIALRRAPDSARANAMAGLMLLQSAERGERIHTDGSVLAYVRAHCANALRLDAEYELPRVCLARLAGAEGRAAKSYRLFETALAVSPDRNDRILAALARLGLERPAADLQAEERQISAGLEYLARALREYPHSAEVQAAAGRIHHRLGHPEQARRHYDRARSLRPDRWDVVFWGLELSLDVGDAAAAQDTWERLRDTSLLRSSDPIIRAALAARLGDARRLFPPKPDRLPTSARSAAP